MSLLGPLTTTFTAPTSCPTGISAVDGYIFQGAQDTAACLPSGYSASVGDYYSPGLACPSAYTPACSSIASIADVTETAYTCCPTWLSYGCQSTADFQWSWQSTLGCTIVSNSDYPFTTSIEVVDGTTSYASSRTFSGYGGINAYSVAIRFQQSDLTSSSSTTATIVLTSSPSSIVPAATSSISSSSSATSTMSSSRNTGLSSGAAAGMGAAIAIVVILAIGAGFYCVRRMKKRSVVASAQDFEHDRPELGSGNELSPAEAPSSEMVGGYHDRTQFFRELRAEEVAKELDGRMYPSELDGHRRAELP